MKNNKGFTVVELLASFSLTMVIVVFLFEILIEVKDLYYEAGVKTEVLQKQSMLVNKIRNNLDTNELSGVNCAGDSCTLTFADNDPVNLTIDSNNNAVIYDDTKYLFPEDVVFSDYSLQTCEVDASTNKPTNDLGLMAGTAAKNCYLKLNITISSASLEKDYPINIVYPYVYDPSFVSGDFIGESDKAGSSTWYTCTSSVQEYTAEETGTYSIELLGASGGASDNGKLAGGAGAYTKGEIYLKANEKLYFNVGCAGSKLGESETASIKGGYNGGGNGSTASTGISTSGGGGGATDVRIGSNDLKSRIMVAAGGSGAGNGENAKAGTPGGSLIAANSNSVNGPKGATQTSGNALGIGGSVAEGGGAIGSGGGGGYYGGSAGIKSGTTGTSGTGGSSFISGHFGSNAVNSSNSHTGQSIHYSGKIFYNSVMYSGDKVPEDKTSEFFSDSKGSIPYVGDGYAVITYEKSSIPKDAENLSSVKANYPLEGTASSLWLDGHDNIGYGIHDSSSNIWANLSGGASMTLTNAKWKNNGLDLSTTGTITTDVTKAFTLSTVFTLTSYPSGTVALVDGKIGLCVNSSGKIGFWNGTCTLFDYNIKKINTKEYLTVVGNGNEIVLYANGEKKSTLSLSTSNASGISLTLPAKLNGTLHRLSVYKSALTVENVETIYSEDVSRFGPTAKALDNLKLEYVFNEEGYSYKDPETEELIVSDVSGNEKNAKIIGSNSFDASNKGFAVNGGTNYIEMPGDVNYRYTAVLVTSASSISGTPVLFGNSTYPTLYLNSSKNYSFNSQGVNASFNHTFTVGKKEYIVITYDGANINLYIDGSKKASVSSTTDPTSIASAYLGKEFNGIIYKYALYDRVLLDDEIKFIYEYDYSVFK